MFTRGVTAAAFTLACVLATIGSASAQLANSDWPMFMHDLQHTGKTTVLGPVSGPVKVKWSYSPHSLAKSQPALGPDGTVYVGISQAVGGTKFAPLCALDGVTGDLKWCTSGTADANSSSPAVGVTPHADTVFIGARDNALWAANDSDGSLAWWFKIHLDGDVMSSPSIAPDGTIYMTCGCLSAGIVWAMNPDSSVRWSLQIPGPGINNSAVAVSNQPPAPGVVRRLYVGGNDGSLWAIDDLGGPSAKVAWTLKPKTAKKNANYNSSPAVDTQGHIYWGSNQGFFAVRDDGTKGTLLWSKSLAGRVDTTPAIDNVHQTVIVSAMDKKTRTLYAFDFNGNHVWTPLGGPSKKTQAHMQSPSAVIDSAGNVYAAIGSHLYAFNAAGAPLWDSFLPADVISMALGEGTLYLGAKDKTFYALSP